MRRCACFSVIARSECDEAIQLSCPCQDGLLRCARNDGRRALQLFAVMPGLVPGIHVLSRIEGKNVDGRDAPGHDAGDSSLRGANATKQSSFLIRCQDGLLRCARNDGMEERGRRCSYPSSAKRGEGQETARIRAMGAAGRRREIEMLRLRAAGCLTGE
jgi:hypothetical protein